MPLSRAKYRKVTDLYVTGAELVLKDGTVMWLQVLNPFEMEEARHAAQSARARLVMALQNHGGDEMAYVEAALWSDGIEQAREKVLDFKAAGSVMEAVLAIKNDPDWKERLDILDRTDADETPLEPAEKELFQKLQLEYVAEVQRRVQDEESYLAQELAKAGREELLEEYKRLYIDRRGAEVANSEFRVTEVFYGARVCEGKQLEGDEVGWDHSGCEGHQVQVFESKAEVRSLPEELAEQIGLAYQHLAMSLRDAKDLDRLASSSVSSRQPSAEAASTPSTPDETPSDAPGTSPQPSLTPSPS